MIEIVVSTVIARVLYEDGFTRENLETVMTLIALVRAMSFEFVLCPKMPCGIGCSKSGQSVKLQM